MKINPVGFGSKCYVDTGSRFAANLSPPDENVRVDTPPGPERLLRLLYLRWHPSGKGRPDRATDQEVGEWIDGMIIGDATPEEREAFLYQAWALGWRLVGLLNRFGTKVELLSDPAYESRYGFHSAGQYVARFKVIHIKRSALFCNSSSTVIHEFGHAIDHLISSLCNGGHQISIKLWHWFSHQRTGFVSDYAETVPAEYLAESLEAYFLHSEFHLLQNRDPAMYTFLDDLITISSG